MKTKIGEIDELVMALYSKGISTRNSAEILHTIFRNRCYHRRGEEVLGEAS